MQQMSLELEKFLIKRHYLVSKDDVEKTVTTENENKYLNAYLLSNFGIIVDKPHLLTKGMIKNISTEYQLTVPESFYSNPQDLAFFTRDELLIEQIISYFAYGSDLGRIEIFKKDLPEYVEGDELKLREFYIIDEDEAKKVLKEILTTFCAYTRPFSVEELHEFLTLYDAGYYSNEDIKCKDNIFSLLEKDIEFAKLLDKKDLVKLSISIFGDKASFKTASTYQKKLLKQQMEAVSQYVPYVKDCPLSKKQAKYFNKITAVSKLNVPKESNIKSPDKLALAALRDNDVLKAAEIYAKNGALLERHIKMLLSRANPIEAVKILDMFPAENPIVLYQLLSTLTADTGDARTFTFYHDNKVKTHRETDYEKTYRKSRLNEATRKLLADTCIEKIKDYYKALPNLGKIYIDEPFYKIGLPTNTSASGKGIDVLPTGSRIPCIHNNIRTFVHWKNAFDIDSSLIVVDEQNNLQTIGWFNYTNVALGHDVLFSGDITGKFGAEYFDINIDRLARKGYKYVIQTFQGFNSKLDSGEIYTGYQVKNDLKTKAWDAKNIEMQFRVHGDSRGCVAFAIDLQTKEVIILNQIVDSEDRVVRPEGFRTIEKYLQPNYLDINIGTVAECRGEVVTDPAEADVIFSDTYTVPVLEEHYKDTPEDFVETEAKKEPKIIRSYELEKLVAFINN